MDFRLLGPLEAGADAAPLRLGGRKPRALLACLLLDANHTVSVEQLIDELWGERPPDTATKMVQIYVSQLRKVLPDGMLRTRPGGYALQVEPDAIDLNRFEALRAGGRAALLRGDPGAAAERLREALEVWRGPALAEFNEPDATAQRVRLDELRLGCLEDRIDADLVLGCHADVVPELELQIARHPLRERLRTQLMLALYRCGRQADALATYQAYRRTLDEELGIAPSADLRALESAILAHDAGLLVAPPAAAAAPSVPRAPSVLARPFGREGEVAGLHAALAGAAARRGGRPARRLAHRRGRRRQDDAGRDVPGRGERARRPRSVRRAPRRGRGVPAAARRARPARPRPLQRPGGRAAEPPRADVGDPDAVAGRRARSRCAAPARSRHDARADAARDARAASATPGR